MLSFLANAFAESTCTCVEESEAHESREIKHNSEHQDHEHEAEEQHCSHVCSQCHLVALNFPVFYLSGNATSFEVNFLSPTETLRSISQSLYRPPIL